MQVAIDIADRVVIDEFHRLQYHNRGLLEWMGAPTYKLPSDLLLYQEAIFRNRPDVIIETGTMFGGSALFFAHMMDLAGHGRVITIDIADIEHVPCYEAVAATGFTQRPIHPRIQYIKADSVKAAGELDVAGQSVMVVLDSDHTKPHVLRELRAYAPMVTVGQFLVVEDTNINGHPVEWGGGEGPYEALLDYDQAAGGFEDQHMEKAHLITYHTWLVKTKEAPCLPKK
jgi:cephalosporin hydroxylase